MSQISGGCLCGAIQYTCDGPAIMTAMCNCKNCQKQSGSAFSINVIVPKGSLQLTTGMPTIYEDKGDSGLPVYRHFCANCGSPLFSDVTAMPQIVALKAGTLDDTSWVKPTLSVWCDSAQNWVHHPEDAPRFPKNPPME